MTTMDRTWTMGSFTFTTWTEDCGCVFTVASNDKDFLDCTFLPDETHLCETGRMLYAAKLKADIDWQTHCKGLK